MDLKLIDYDGINLFNDGKWTGIAWASLNEAKRNLELLNTFNEDQFEMWLHLNKDYRYLGH